jgi:hypothetical protein
VIFARRLTGVCMKGKLVVFSAVCALTVSALAPALARADTGAVRDGNDVAMRLDIRSVAQGHKGTALTHTLRTYRGFSSRFLGGDNGVLFAFDTNGSARSAERFVVVFWSGGRLRAVVANGKGHAVGKARASRPNNRSVMVRLSRGSLGNPADYRWRGFTVVGNALDAAPNRRLIHHDITAPDIAFPNQPIPTDTSYDVTFSLFDRGGAGVKSWTLQRRPFGMSSWSSAGTGSGGGSKAVHVTAAAGENDRYRVIAVDRAGNKRISVIRTVSVPVDDADAAIVYTGSSWNHATGVADVFLGTLSSSANAGDGFSFDFTGTFVAVIGTGTCATGPVDIEDSNGDSVLTDFAAPCNGQQHQILFKSSLDRDSYTLKLNLNGGGALSVDGIVAR